MKSKLKKVPSLADYVAELGDDVFAKKYGVSIRTAASYRLGDRSPRRKVAERIVNDKDSPLDWGTIYAPTKKVLLRSLAA